MAASSKTVTELVNNINDRIPDNNAGQISAKDVRETMRDVAFSIPYIVASGEWDVSGLEFVNDVRLRRTSDDSDGGTLIVQSGIVFENNGNPDGTALQTRPYLGPTGISHSELKDLTGTSNDHHTQYLRVDGVRPLTGDFGTDTHFISSSGEGNTTAGHGIQFEYVDTNKELLHVGNETEIKFDLDNSIMSTAKSNAAAWVTFDGVSGVGEANTLTVLTSYNVSAVKRVTEGGVPQAGKFRIYFKPNTFGDALGHSGICAIGKSNGRSSNANAEAFDENTVACVVRNTDYVSFNILDESNQYVDGKVNDLIVFGVPSGVTYSDSVTVGYQAS